MKAFTSQDDAEIKSCIEMILATDAGKGFIHESFNVNDCTNLPLRKAFASRLRIHDFIQTHRKKIIIDSSGGVKDGNSVGFLTSRQHNVRIEEFALDGNVVASLLFRLDFFKLKSIAVDTNYFKDMLIL